MPHNERGLRESRAQKGKEEEIMTEQNAQPYRSGFVAMVGRPNVGKSTLTNALVGKPVAITSDRPETTRKAIRAIVTTPNAQLVLVDTPGIHRPRTLLGKRLDDVVEDSLSDVDAVAFLLPATDAIGPGDRRILAKLKAQFASRGAASTRESTNANASDAPSASLNSHHGIQSERPAWGWRKPVIGVVTKIDELSRDDLMAKMLEVAEFGHFTQVVPVSALASRNVDEVKRVLIDAMPEGPQMYPAEMTSEETPSERIAELIRGAFLETLRDELPHSLAVVVDDLVIPDDPAAHARAFVSLYVERDSQKPIIIGHKANNLVRVKARVRKAVNAAVGRKTDLDLHVKVAKGWQSDAKQLARLGF